MKKLLLLAALIPSLSFAAIGDATIRLTTGGGRVGEKIRISSECQMTFHNNIGVELEYSYNFQMCPKDHNCEVVKGTVKVRPYQTKIKNLYVTKSPIYWTAGTYEVVAAINIWGNGNEKKHHDVKANIYVVG